MYVIVSDGQPVKGLAQSRGREGTRGKGGLTNGRVDGLEVASVLDGRPQRRMLGYDDLYK